MWTKGNTGRYLAALLVTGTLTVAGCLNAPIEVGSFWRGPAPLRIQSPGEQADACDCYEDSLTGGQVFQMYCSYCHNAPTLAERPFSNYQNVALHMRNRANLTGKEYAKLIGFLRHWHDVGPPNRESEPSPKKITFSQPIQELRPQEPGTGAPPVTKPAQPQ